MFIKELEILEARYEELEGLLASPDVLSDRERSHKLAKELSAIKEPVALFREYKKVLKESSDLEALLEGKHDQEFGDLAKKELDELKAKEEGIKEKIESALTQEDKDADRDIIVEIRQGTGGDEAGLFAADLYRMYNKYAAKKGWKAELISSATNESGGIKEVSFAVKGKDVYRRLKFESGVHRVQRVPATEAQGRIHTSTATVAVLIEPEEVEFSIDPADLRIDTFRSSGPGGQHMQKTDSAVRITHIPSGVVVACQDERSQLKNKLKAMRVLRAKLLDAKKEAESKKISQERKMQVGSGDRSEKIRTYNFPDRRVTDHRINFTTHALEAVLEGEFDVISDALIKAAKDASRGNRE